MQRIEIAFVSNDVVSTNASVNLLLLRNSFLSIENTASRPWKQHHPTRLALHVQAPSLKVLLYADGKVLRHQEPKSLLQYDIVIASYGIVLHDSPEKLDRVLFK